MFYDLVRGYLDSTLIDPSTTSTTKLPPVQAHLVYHPRVKAKTSAPTHPIHIHLRGLDAGWCVKRGPHRKGTRSRCCGRRLTDTPGGRLTVGRKGDVGTDSATPADWAAAPPRLNVQCVPGFLLLGACSYFGFPTLAVSAENCAGHTSSSAMQRLL